MFKQRHKTKRPNLVREKSWSRTRNLLTLLGMTGLVTGCGNADLTSNHNIEALPLPSPTPTSTPWPALTPTAITATPKSTLPPAATHTPWPTSTPRPTSTPWSTPQAWNPVPVSLPNLAPVPVVLPSVAPVTGNVPVSYSPPDGVDVFGSTILRWVYYGDLAPDEWFDIKIKPLGSESSVFVDWAKVPEYQLQPWSGWTPGLYTWQIGIVKGYKEGDTKQFIADTGRDSAKFTIKWQAPGSYSGGGGGGSSSVGGGSTGGSSGGS